MYRAILVFCPLLLLAACGSSSNRGLALPAPSPVPFAPVSSDEITPGESVERVFTGPAQYFFLTPPEDGTLTVTFSWDPDRTDTLLKLVIDDYTNGSLPSGPVREFQPTGSAPSPVVGMVPVEAGSRYRLAVALWATGFSPNDPYVLTTSLN